MQPPADSILNLFDELETAAKQKKTRRESDAMHKVKEYEHGKLSKSVKYAIEVAA